MDGCIKCWYICEDREDDHIGKARVERSRYSLSISYVPVISVSNPIKDGKIDVIDECDWRDLIGGRGLIEGCIFSHSPSTYHTLKLLMKMNCAVPSTKPMTPSIYWRGIVSSAFAIEDARVARIILYMPKDSWFEDNGTVEQATAILKWSDLTVPTFTGTRTGNPIHLGGLGRTVGVDENQTKWPVLSHEDLQWAAISGSAMHLMPWMIYAYGMDPNVVPMISTMNQHYLTLPTEIITECPYAINEIVDLLDSSGYNPHTCEYVPVTGDPIHEPLYINKDCKWIGARIIDIARVPVPHGSLSVTNTSSDVSLSSPTTHLLVRVAPLAYSPMFDGMPSHHFKHRAQFPLFFWFLLCVLEWIRVSSSRIRRTSTESLVQYKTIRCQRHVGESVMDWLTREQPETLPAINEALNGVAHVRTLIASILTSMLPSVLHSLIAFYAI
jgi:hypothetical protein